MGHSPPKIGPQHKSGLSGPSVQGVARSAQNGGPGAEPRRAALASLCPGLRGVGPLHSPRRGPGRLAGLGRLLRAPVQEMRLPGAPHFMRAARVGCADCHTFLTPGFHGDAGGEGGGGAGRRGETPTAGCGLTGAGGRPRLVRRRAGASLTLNYGTGPRVPWRGRGCPPLITLTSLPPSGLPPAPTAQPARPPPWAQALRRLWRRRSSPTLVSCAAARCLGLPALEPGAGLWGSARGPEPPARASFCPSPLSPCPLEAQCPHPCGKGGAASEGLGTRVCMCARVCTRGGAASSALARRRWLVMRLVPARDRARAAASH